MAHFTASSEEYAQLEATLLNTSGDVPLAKRFRALFTLKAIKSHRAIDIIGRGGRTSLYETFTAIDVVVVAGFSDSSALLGHELAYVLGQINDTHALPALEAVLRDEKQHPMVRHEVCRVE